MGGMTGYKKAELKKYMSSSTRRNIGCSLSVGVVLSTSVVGGKTKKQRNTHVENSFGPNGAGMNEPQTTPERIRGDYYYTYY